MAEDYFLARTSDESNFRQTIFDSLGGRNLRELGMDRDIDLALQQDLFDCIPAWDAETGRIRL
jgi:phosphosulfolactate phosphohydrolase-like enzyme